MAKLGVAIKSFTDSLFNREVPTSSNEPNGLVLSGENSVLFQSIFSNAWETINQKFYTRLAQSIDPIDSLITFYAEILSSGILKAKDKDEINVTDSDSLIQLLKNPNEYQNFKEFIKEWLYYHYAHGWNYVYPKSNSVGFEKDLTKNSEATKTRIYNLDPDHIVWRKSLSNFVLNFLGFLKDKSILFDYKPLGFAQIEYSNVIPFIDVRQNPEKPWTGISRLLSLKKQIQNFSNSLDGKENLLKRTGSILVSLDRTTEDMGLDSEIGTGLMDKEGNPITTTHKKNLENQIRNTGLGNDSKGVIFSILPLKSQPLSAGLENIDFDRYGDQDRRQINSKFNLPREFDSTFKDAPKFANRQLAFIEVIQNTIEPLAISFCDKMVSYFNHENKLVIDFSHLPVFADNKKTKIETQQLQFDLLVNLLDKGTITQNEFNEKIKDYGII